MFKLNEGLSGPVLGSDDVRCETRDELYRLNADIRCLKQRIANQISHIQELTWEAQDSTSAQKALDEMRETLGDWYAERDLLNKLLRGES
jgi:hypothetical protein